MAKVCDVFLFDLEDRVKLSLSGEEGTVIGIATYLNHENQYYVRYVDGTGCQGERWIDEDALERIADPSEIVLEDFGGVDDEDTTERPQSAAVESPAAAEAP